MIEFLFVSLHQRTTVTYPAGWHRRLVDSSSSSSGMLRRASRGLFRATTISSALLPHFRALDIPPLYLARAVLSHRLLPLTLSLRVSSQESRSSTLPASSQAPSAPRSLRLTVRLCSESNSPALETILGNGALRVTLLSRVILLRKLRFRANLQL
jgi:hypothetical protein